MKEVILVIHLFLALAIIGLVLLQRSEGGGLGIGGGNAGGLTTAQGAANFLTRATAICAGLFICTSLILGIIAGQNSGGGSILEALEQDEPAVAAPVEENEEPPSVPLAE